VVGREVPVVFVDPPAEGQSDQQVAVDEAEYVVTGSGGEDLPVSGVAWPRAASWVKATARNAAISNWYQERPSSPKTVQPATNKPTVVTIFAV
jgi:hypothetical protein